MNDLDSATEGERQRQTELKHAWDAVPQQGGKKGCVLNASKEIVGVLAISDDATLILKRQQPEAFVVVSREETSDWRISPYDESHRVQFVCVGDLLC